MDEYLTQAVQRCIDMGAKTLTDAELLSLICGNGKAGGTIAARHTPATLAAAHPFEVAALFGGGEGAAQIAARVAAAIELGARAAAGQSAEQPLIQSAQDMANLFLPALRGLDQEELHVLLVNHQSRLMAGPLMVYRGTLGSVDIRVAEVFREAMVRNAAAIALAHNHPSGDVTPSRADIETTKAVAQAGVLLGIPLLDHIVVGKCGWRSLREQHLVRM